MISKSIQTMIEQGEKIAIFGHVSPDFDCLGSAFGLKEYLKYQQGKVVDIFCDGTISKTDEKIFKSEKINETEFLFENYDLIITVDTPNSKRLGKFGSEVLKHSNVLKIDHHYDEVYDMGKVSVVETESASCSEMIYLILKELKATITPQIATYLYAGIATDTNSFLNDNTTPRTMKIASELFEIGADIFKVNDVTFKSISKNRWDLTKLAYDKAEFFDNFAILILNLKDLKNMGDDVNNLSRYANTLITVEGIDIACSISEKALRTFACSFRSVSGVRVDKIAQELGGGGHKQASACILGGSEKQVKKKIIDAIIKGLKEQNEQDEN